MPPLSQLPSVNEGGDEDGYQGELIVYREDCDDPMDAGLFKTVPAAEQLEPNR